MRRTFQLSEWRRASPARAVVSLMPAAIPHLPVRPGMLRRIWRYSRLGAILGIANFLISVLWIAIAYDNPWHQVILFMLDYPASYIVNGPHFSLSDIMPNQYIFQTVACDTFYVVIGAVWFFAIGALIQKSIIGLRKAIARKNG